MRRKEKVGIKPSVRINKGDVMVERWENRVAERSAEHGNGTGPVSNSEYGAKVKRDKRMKIAYMSTTPL